MAERKKLWKAIDAGCAILMGVGMVALWDAGNLDESYREILNRSYPEYSADVVKEAKDVASSIGDRAESEARVYAFIPSKENKRHFDDNWRRLGEYATSADVQKALSIISEDRFRQGTLKFLQNNDKFLGTDVSRSDADYIGSFLILFGLGPLFARMRRVTPFENQTVDPKVVVDKEV